MGYPCYYNYNKSCDACGHCNHNDDNKLCCCICENPIEEDEMYFEIDNDVYCRECLEDIYGRYI